MDASMKMFNGSEVATMLVFMALVWLADRVSAWPRPG
jgi:phosphonate transport system permease protein